jgi:hypothetical protein
VYIIITDNKTRPQKMNSTLFFYIYDTAPELKHLIEADEKIICEYLLSIGVEEKTFQKCARGEFSIDNVPFARRSIFWYSGHGKASSNDDDVFPSFTKDKSKRVHQTNLHQEMLNKKTLGVELLITVFNCCNFSGLANEDISAVRDSSPTIFDFIGSVKICASTKGSKAYYDNQGSYFTKAFFKKFDTNWSKTIDNVNHALISYQTAIYAGKLDYMEMDLELPKELNNLRENFNKAMRSASEEDLNRREIVRNIIAIESSQAQKKRKLNAENAVLQTLSQDDQY